MADTDAMQGFLGAVGAEMGRRNIMTASFQHQGNEEMAQQLEKMAETAKPQFQPDYLQMAAKYRALPIGAKPSKDMDLHQLMIRQVQHAHESQQTQNAQAAQPQANLNRMSPPSAAAMAAFPGASNPTATSGPASNPGPPLSQLPKEWSGPVPGGSQSLPPPPGMGPTSGQPGLPGSGYGDSAPNVIAGGSSGSSGFQSPMTVGLPQGGQADVEYTQFTPQERMAMTAAGEGMKYNAQYGAQSTAQIATEKAKLQNQMDMMKQFMGSTGADGSANSQHYMYGFGPEGPSIKPDRGVGVPGYQLDPETGEVYRGVRYANGPQGRVNETGPTHQILLPNADGSATTHVVDMYGREVGQVQGASYPKAAFAPTVTKGGGSHQQWVDIGGEKVLTTVSNSSSSTRQKVIPGMGGAGAGASKAGGTLSPPPTMRGGGRAVTQSGGQGVQGGSPRTLEKGLNPNQAMTAEGKLGAINNTISLAQKVQQALPLLNNLLDAGKIQMQIDPKQGIVTALLNRSVKLSPEEAQLAGNFASLMEHINTLRGPLGATGFRGAEAFNALQAQRGQLMANPAVTNQVLTNTLTALQSQQGALSHGLGKGRNGGRATSGMNAPMPPGGGATLPPQALSQLQEGHTTVFKNGQAWTLHNGQPQMIGGR